MRVHIIRSQQPTTKNAYLEQILMNSEANAKSIKKENNPKKN